MTVFSQGEEEMTVFSQGEMMVFSEETMVSLEETISEGSLVEMMELVVWLACEGLAPFEPELRLS